MWKCENCGATLEDNFEYCYKCSETPEKSEKDTVSKWVKNPVITRNEWITAGLIAFALNLVFTRDISSSLLFIVSAALFFGGYYFKRNLNLIGTVLFVLLAVEIGYLVSQGSIMISIFKGFYGGLQVLVYFVSASLFKSSGSRLFLILSLVMGLFLWHWLASPFYSFFVK